MARPTTTNYALQKSLGSDPERTSGLAEHWGPVMDANLDAIDAAIVAAATTGLADTATLALGLQETVTSRTTDTSAPITQKVGTVALAKVTAGSWTLAAPTSGTDDGKTLTLVATTAHAHQVVTPSNKLNGGSTTLTFAAAGDSATLVAIGGVWYTRSLTGTVAVS
jgi:hypothetical protein